MKVKKKQNYDYPGTSAITEVFQIYSHLQW